MSKMPSPDNYFVYHSAIGRLIFRYETSPFRLVHVEFESMESKGLLNTEPPSAACRIVEWFDSYFRKSPSAIPWTLLKTEGFTPLQQAVWAAAAKIDFGSLATYADLACAIGRPGAARFVGNALGLNPFPILIPCHRVIRSNGGLGGFSGGVSFKRRLLELESSHNHPMLAH